MNDGLIQTKLNFFDDFWIDFRPGTIRRWFYPQLKSHYADGDFMASAYCSAFYDEIAGKYRLFYEVSPDLANDAVRYLALAESDDGLHYKPVEINDNLEARMRRVVFDGGSGLHGTSVLFDPFDPEPGRRYKCATMAGTGDKRKQENRVPMPVTAAFSPDGVHWTEHPELVLHPYTSDAFNCLFYNPLSKEYCLILRGGYVDRRIAMRTSKDMVNWSDPFIIQHPSPKYNDNLIEMQFYSMWAGFVDGAFLGLQWWFNTSLTDMDFSKMWGFMETELLYSYDGKYFMQTSGKQVIDRPPAPALGCSQLSLMGLMENRTKDEYILYGGGSKFMHGTAATNKEFAEKITGPSAAVVFATIRKDGFCGIEGMRGGSQVITKSMQFLKGDLTLNINASVGFARFGLMNAKGEFYEGFSYEDSVSFTGDGVKIKPEWKNAKIDSLVGKQVRIAIELNNATLHSVNMTARPYIVGPQAGFHNPMQLESNNKG